MAVVNSFTSRRSISKGHDSTARPFHHCPFSVSMSKFTGILGAKEKKDCFLLRCFSSQGPAESSFLTTITAPLAFLAQGCAVRRGLEFGFSCLFLEEQKHE